MKCQQGAKHAGSAGHGAGAAQWDHSAGRFVGRARLHGGPSARCQCITCSSGLSPGQPRAGEIKERLQKPYPVPAAAFQTSWPHTAPPLWTPPGTVPRAPQSPGNHNGTSIASGPCPALPPKSKTVTTYISSPNLLCHPAPSPGQAFSLKRSRLEGQGSWSLVTEAAAATTGRHTHQQEWNAETAITYEHECLSATANSFRETQRWKPSSQHKGHTAPVSSRCSDTYQLRDLV
ncbi:uncharacterized protein Gm53582 [Mus musculus]|uniref:uncharacterized protein Gm53582 n=1 Tax=Mus musculus TaxID=10090 RepID=UPI0005ABA8C5|nr:uncharacterized protein Gm53582 [Mus musculus]|eukprot:XP_011241948.1 PREDICTED: uncharacterized protein Gm36807 [Mus musculus]